MGNLVTVASFKEPTTLEDCDSTWESDSGEESEKEEADTEESDPEEVAAAPDTGQGDRNSAEQSIKPKRSFYAARDLYKYRHQYPQNLKDLRGQNDLCNLRFYMNKIPFKPEGVFIEEILNKWRSDYDKLEHNHTYIQWLFPLREQGLNFYAKELTSFEIEEFKKTKEAMKRYITAYKMMLDFFGLKLVDKNGNVSRSANWEDRFQHLNESQHNYLRITRILKSLGELGYEHFKPKLVRAFLQESIVENTIPNMKQSALEYFVYTVKDRSERRKLLRFARRHYQPSEHFIWGPPMKGGAQESKPCKNLNRHTNRSQQRHTHKSKDAKHALETSRTSSLDERTIRSSQEEEGTQETSRHEQDSDVKMSEQPHNEEMDTKLKEQHIENVINLESIDHIMDVANNDCNGKDCLCSQSPDTSAPDLSTSLLQDITLEKEENC